MAVKSNLPLNSPSALTPPSRGEGRSDTVSAKPERTMRNGIEARRKKQKQPSNPSSIFEGLQTLYS
jgi:hypothetical protein